MKTPIQEIIHWIEVRLSMFPKDLNFSDRCAYDAYYNILSICKSKLHYEKITMKNIFTGGVQNVGTCIKKAQLLSFEDYYDDTFENEKFTIKDLPVTWTLINKIETIK